MAVRDIRKLGDTCLKQTCIDVTDFGKDLHELLQDLQDTLLTTSGVGIAAPQIGSDYRVFITKDIDSNEIIEYINPVITETGNFTERTEACLSVPELMGDVDRPEHVIISAQTRFGNKFTSVIDGIMARVVDHENAHLDGQLYIEIAKNVRKREEIKEDDIDEN